jgi:preprotein translocase subunit YajC
MFSESSAVQALLVLSMFLGVYVFLVGPQRRRVADHGAFVAALKPGDRVVTGGGLLGRIVSCEPTLLTVALADGVHVQALRTSVDRFPPPNE